MLIILKKTLQLAEAERKAIRNGEDMEDQGVGKEDGIDRERWKMSSWNQLSHNKREAQTLER